ncbi:hypothetical protein BC833DRAFT_626808, partial [Globomyces pollinis-pini]
MVAQDSEVVAVEHAERSITYGELNRQANIVAANLVSRGVKIGDYVAIITIRSIEMIISILGVLKAGAAYVPIDADIPLERINYILDDAKSEVILYHPEVSQDILAAMEQSKLLNMMDMNSLEYQPIAVPSSSPAYVVFTSGSTGKPKGVVISHGSLNNFATIRPNILDVEKGTRVGQICTISFDLCVGEIFCTLLCHGTLVLRQKEDFFAAIKQVDAIFTTPTTVLKLNPKDFPNLKRIVTAGEPMHKNIIDNWSDVVDLRNGYGPTETTIASSYQSLTKESTVTVGKPFPNTLQYIVDKEMQLLPLGVPGELVIGGAIVSLGYLNRPDLTADRFIPNHFTNDGSLMYRSGDI